MRSGRVAGSISQMTSKLPVAMKTTIRGDCPTEGTTSDPKTLMFPSQSTESKSPPPQGRVRGKMEGMEIPPLPRGTILLVEVGSTAHGTGLPGGEDNDELAVIIEEPSAVLGLDDVGFSTVMQRTQPEGSRSGPGDTDRTIHSLRRFIRLAASGNPSILMTLWAPVIEATD